VVKQKLLAYVPGEVAHIENVLKGEYKDRKHRVLDRAETTVFTSDEESQETERDTQSTERFELKKEAEKVIKEDMSVQAGVTVTGAYQAGEGASFSREPVADLGLGGEGRRQLLDRHGAVEPPVAPQVHDPHPAPPDLALDVVVGKHLSDAARARHLRGLAAHSAHPSLVAWRARPP
jgi:hypothetical protein